MSSTGLMGSMSADAQDTRFPYEVAVILPGGCVSQEPKVVYTVLGSCISVCLRDPLAGVGGMNHFMLSAPASVGGQDSWADWPIWQFCDGNVD